MQKLTLKAIAYGKEIETTDSDEIDFEESLEHIKTIAVFIGYSPKTVEKYLGTCEQ